MENDSEMKHLRERLEALQNQVYELSRKEAESSGYQRGSMTALCASVDRLTKIVDNLLELGVKSRMLRAEQQIDTLAGMRLPQSPGPEPRKDHRDPPGE